MGQEGAAGRIAVIGRWLVLSCVLLFALVVGARAETLTLATYNVENYVAANRMVDGMYRENYPKPEAAKAALRSVIRSLDADLLALQEIGSEAHLEELRRDLKSEGVDYPFFAWLEAADKDRHVALLSRRPLTAVVRHTDLTFSYLGRETPVKRGLLEVRIATTAGELTLFVFHLKSRYTDEASDPQSQLRRAGEAEAIRDRVLRQFPDPSSARFLVLGDCNDSPGSRPLRALTQRGRRTIAHLLPAADSRGETWTHYYRREDVYSRVYYILASPALAPTVVNGAAVICDLPETAAASDHRPVSVRLNLSRAE